MMKRLRLLLTFFLLTTLTVLSAQTENDPCSAPCLGPAGTTSGSTPPADGTSPNTNLPCGGGTSEDNPTWYTFVAGCTNFNLGVSVSGCASGSSIQVTIFEGDDCGAVGAAGCVNCVTGGSVSLATVPGKQYWIQVDGCAEAICNFSLTYDPACILKDIPKPIITGPLTACKGTTQDYSAMIPGGIVPSGYTWNIVPASAGQIIGQGEPSIQVKWNQTGTFQLCATPKFNVKCPVTGIQKGCITVVVTELKEAICSKTICAEEAPFDYPLMPCIQSANPNVNGTPDPDVFVILGPAGTTKTTTINYTMDPSGCSGKVKLTATVKAKGTKVLPPMLICEDDSIKVGTSWLKCANASAGIQNYTVEYNSNKPTVCDTTYNFILQCIKINPIVTPANPSLDCNNTSVTLKAGNSIFLPTSNAANPGVKSYLWSTNATTPEITVTTAGIYCVTISYEYTLNTSSGTVTKKCSKVKCITVVGTGSVPATPVPIALNPYPCLGDTASYTVTVNPNTTYNWTITGGTPATFTGNTIKVQWGNTPPYKVCAEAESSCGKSLLPGCVDITLNEGPKLPIITGPTPICAGDTMTTYSTPKLTTPNPTYTWTLPAGASFVGKTDSNVINVKWANNATSGPITLVVGDKCGKSPVATLNIVINQLPAAPTGITGDLDVCKNDKIDYTVAPLVPFAMDYNWTVEGGMITSSTAGLDTKTITVMWTKVANDNKVCVSAVNNCDTIGTKFCITVSTKDFPQPTAGSDKSVCGLVTKLNGSVPPTGNTGLWTQLSGPGTSTFDDDTKPKAEVTVTECGEYKFVWTETNSAGCSGKDTVTITFSEKPTITNPVVSCDPVAKTFTATFNVIGCLSPYIVTLNNIAGSTPQTLSTAPFTFTTPNITQTTKFVEYAVQSGSCTTNFVDTVDCNCVTKAGEMDLQATQTACSAGGGKVKAIHKTGTETTDNNDVTAYILYEGTATTLTQGILMNKSGEFTFNSATMECGKTYYIGFLVGNNDGTGFPSGSDQCLKLTPVNQEVKWDCVPKPNAGVDDEVCGLSYILKATTPAAGVTGVWSSTNGATFTPSDSPTATVTIPDPAGTYKFFWTETNGKCKDSASVNITFKDSDINQNPDIKYICDGQNENYTVKFDVSGGKAPYFVLDCTTNAVVATLNTAPYTFTSGSFVSGSSFCFKIADSNGCDTITINKSYACGCATQLGSFNLTTDVCVGTDLKAVRAQNDVLDANDTWEFILADIGNPKDPSINIYARNQTGIFSFDPATMQCDKTYKLIYAIGNKSAAGTGVKFDDPCLAASSKDVKFICIPSTVSSIVKVDTCAKQVTLNSTGKIGTWTVDPVGSITFADPTDPKGVANGVTWGTYKFTWTENNNGCKASSDAPLTLVSPSNLSYKNNVVCDAANKTYTLSVDLSGAAPFKVDAVGTNIGGNIVGNVFTSDPVESGKQISLSFKDAVSCIPTTYNFDHTCPCDSKAGTMDPTQLKLCEGTDAEASAPPASGVVLDGDDTFEFILHEGATTTLGSIKGRNKTGKFKFDAATMQYGKLYYISYVVGDDKAGQVDLNYFCKDIAKGTPVVWNENPTLIVTKDETICKGGSTEITLTMTGKADFEIFYSANGPQKPFVSKNNTSIIPVNPTETTEYLFTKVTDSNGCFLDLNKKITVTVNEPAKSGFPSPDRRLCFGLDQNIDMNTEVTGGDLGGTWSVSPATNFTPTTAIFKTKSAAPGTYTFTYTVKGKAPCPDASTSVKVTIDAIPTADAGIDKELNCDNTEITLGGNSTTGNSILYTWTSLDGTPLSNVNVKNPTVKAAGKFALQVKDTVSSCFSYDTCFVKKDISKIDSAAYKVIQPNCFGEDNGSFFVSNVYGGTAPYQFSINNGPFTPYKNFSNLKAGSYFIKMKDNKGCPFQDSILVDQPYEIDVELGAEYEEDADGNQKDFANLGEKVELDAIINFPNNELKKIIWYPACDSCKTLDLIVKPQETTLYAVTVINNKGCIAKDNVLVQVKKPRNVFIPNIFHPESGEDRNRKLRVNLGLDVAKVHYFRVYDRWGDVIHEDIDFTRDQVYQQDKGWDGSFRKERAQPGVYSYSCKVEFVDGYIEIYKGDVLMILKD